MFAVTVIRVLLFVLFVLCVLLFVLCVLLFVLRVCMLREGERVTAMLLCVIDEVWLW